MKVPYPGRYRWSGPTYDVVSLERLVYRRPRAVGIELLRLRPGQVVLDLGCGTGLSFPLLAEGVGAEGHIIGVDSSSSMLGQARRRVARAGWSNVTLLHIDAAHLDPRRLRRLTPCGRGVDALLATYSLSIIPGWRRAWTSATAASRPGARAAVVDLGLPTGLTAPLTPLARLACALGGSDPDRDPGRFAVEQTTDRQHRRFLGGHVVVDAGTLTDTGAVHT